MITRRSFLLSAAAIAMLAPGSIRLADAQDNYPNRLVTFIIGNAPGGDDDTLSRFLAEEIREDLGQTIIVENRGGGATTVAGQVVASSDPDGYRLLCLTTSGIVQTVLRDNLPYDLDAFSPVIGIGGYPMALVVSAQSDIETMDDLVAKAKSADGVTYASAGAGTLAHLTAVRFINEIGGNGVHVSYRNNPEGLQALTGGFTEIMFPSAREAAVLAGNGGIRVLGVTSAQRTANLPDVPTMTELGYPDIDSTLWYGYMAPAGTPDAVVQRLSGAIQKGVQSASFRDKFGPLSFQENILTGPELKDFMTTQASRWQKVIQDNGVRFTD